MSAAKFEPLIFSVWGLALSNVANIFMILDDSFNGSLLNRKYIVMNVLKVLASIISMCNLHVILLSKITPRYFTLFTNGIFRPFNVKGESVDHLSLFFIDFNIPAYTPGRHTV
jgi:hypothetical protein